jgi:hypothetical protein
MDLGIDECDWCLFDLNALTKNLKLETDDRMLTNSPARLETYLKNESTPSNSGWSGATNGGLSDTKMIKYIWSTNNLLL